MRIHTGDSAEKAAAAIHAKTGQFVNMMVRSGKGWDDGPGFELVLEFGEKESDYSPVFGELFTGSYELFNQGNYFELFSNGAIVDLSEIDEEEVENKLKIIINSTVIDVDISFPELILTIHFSNGTSLKLYADDDKYNLSYWKLHTPGKMVLEFGPRKTWSYKQLDVEHRKK